MSSSTTPKKTVLKGDPLRKEGAAGAAGIIPGHLVTRNSAGAYVVHGTAGGNAAPTFAAEQDFLGSDINTAYASGDRVQVNYFRPGDEVYTFLDAGQNAANGAYLESSGDGTLRVHTAPSINEGGSATVTVNTRAIVARALEAVNNSGGSDPVRIKAEVL
ncbi:hypothetical protein FE783_12705 [Paenibacillus mesophilus]|uniref:hypothetical protein n=1 Tax=Paenibacillus mesophilus TaxID=2582849 RepID=UPI00110E5D14|nr:hypothetical protein [Paenibacillus mesophilus]TMV49370.1 hypothetical protein FE783_12705 [Paenibacillus mesophilus]